MISGFSGLLSALFSVFGGYSPNTSSSKFPNTKPLCSVMASPPTNSMTSVDSLTSNSISSCCSTVIHSISQFGLVLKNPTILTCENYLSPAKS